MRRKLTSVTPTRQPIPILCVITTDHIAPALTGVRFAPHPLRPLSMTTRCRTSSGAGPGPWLVGLGLGLFSFWTMAPIAWLILSSLMQQQALTATPPDFSLSAFTFANYLQVLDSAVALFCGRLT